MSLSFSPYQLAIFDWQEHNLGTGKSLTVHGVAGCGKTTTNEEILRRLPKGTNYVGVAFNSPIAAEWKSRMGADANIRTYHSLGLQSIRRTYRNVKIDDDGSKLEGIIKKHLSDREKYLIHPIRKLIGLCKNLLIISPSDATQYSLALEYDIDLYDEYNPENKLRIFDLTRRCLDESLARTDIVDFDDMISMPVLDDKISVVEYDFLGVDEVQDTNIAQLWLVINSVARGGTVIGVGDAYQSIYAFRGANSEAMPQFTKELGADELPLSLCYRCPKSIRDLVNKEFPDIKFEVPEWAIDGTIETVGRSKTAEIAQVGDLILCRINADLVGLAFEFIRKGIKATIKGKAIGKSLVALIKKQKADTVAELFIRLSIYRAATNEKYLAMDKPHKIMQLDDQIATLDALSDGANSVSEVIDRCETIFSDDKPSIQLSSIHKAKGLEADNVFILRPDLLPHPRAKRPEQVQQERNLRYVALTRAKQTLRFVES